MREMGEFDVIVKGGTIATIDSLFQGDIGIRHGLVAALGTDLSGADTIIDATGCYVVPGAIDAHTHFDTAIYGAHTADDFETGSRAAVFGGVTTFINFALQAKGESLRELVTREVERASAVSVADFAFHLIVTDITAETLLELRELADQGFASVKLFTAIDSFRLDDEAILSIMATCAEVGTIVAVHAEDGPLVNYLGRQAAAAGRGIAAFPEMRPPESEAVAIGKVAAYALVTGCELYIVHLSSHAAMEAVRRGRANGGTIYVETRPTYLFMTSDVYDLPNEEGRKYVARPPLRGSADQEALWKAIGNGEIQVYASDHTSWLRAEKLDLARRVTDVPGGLSLVETSVGMLYARGVCTGRLSLGEFVGLTSTNAAKLFGLWPKKGSLGVGADADLVVLDPNRRMQIRAADMQSRSDYDPYEGTEVVGWPALTMSRGEVVMDHGGSQAAAGRGRLVPRSRTPRRGVAR